MKRTLYLSGVLISVALLVISCAEPKNKVKPIEELAWKDLLELMSSEAEGKPIEWHDEPINIATAEGDIIINDTSIQCEKNDCGVLRTITNSNPDKKIWVIVKYEYNLKGIQENLPIEYDIEPGDTLNASCSHFCYNGKSYSLTPTIVASKYKTDGE